MNMEQMKIDYYENRIYEALASNSEHPVDVCMKLIQIIDESDQPDKLFKIVLEYSSLVGDLNNQNPVICSLEEIDRFVRWNFRYIVHYTRLLARKNLPQEKFYQILYSDLITPGNGMLAGSEVSKALTLAILANHVRCVPYYQFSEERAFSNEEFRQSVDRIEDKLQVAYHFLQRDYATKTDEGVQFYRLMESITEERDRIVFLSLLLGLVRKDAVGEVE